ncbi:hypothetical protein NVS55_28475 [Myxococcus stipitatus]|uniref:hypothetical protein n=1 Tax=Myxococcus stipitatus TaxID=83455 RepID=UPI0031455F69
MREAECDDGDCPEVTERCAVACRPEVVGANTCARGQPCLPHGDGGYCGPCQSDQCAAREECVANACRPVECGATTPCLEPTFFCDPVVFTCYPNNGACGSTAACPRFDGRALRTASLECSEGFCRLNPTEHPPIIGLDSEGSVEVVSPRAGQQFESATDFSVSWKGLSRDAIILILRAPPTHSQDLREFAIWGASRPASSVPVVCLGDGVEILEGTWGQASASLPQDRPLYLVVQLVDGPTLVAASRPIPFILGKGWLEAGERCDEDELGPGACENPSTPQACIENRCRRLCASDRDCVELRQSCTLPQDGLRYCR